VDNTFPRLIVVDGIFFPLQRKPKVVI